jgi:hypothetical protein
MVGLAQGPANVETVDVGQRQVEQNQVDALSPRVEGLLPGRHEPDGKRLAFQSAREGL